jgi:uncharacterized protein
LGIALVALCDILRASAVNGNASRIESTGPVSPLPLGMARFEKRSMMPVSREALFAYHERPGALQRLIPPWENVRLIQNDGHLRPGARVILEMKIGPIAKRWVAEHTEYIAGRRFADRAVQGPFAKWEHVHEMVDPGDASSSTSGGSQTSTSVLRDAVDYQLPLGFLGKLGAGFAAKQLETMFAFRHARTAHDLIRHARYAARERKCIAISGASGAVARNLAPFFTVGGHAVRPLVRGATQAMSGIAWNPATGEIDEAKLSECDAMVHLAGSSIAVRWSEKSKREIVASRVPATRLLCERLAKMTKRPSVLVCASAVGYYGDRGEEEITETSTPGDNWSAGVCKQWEDATQPARDAGIRVVNLRIGIVLAARSGALAKMLPPAKLGLAGRVGSGKQWMPWIAMDDLVGVIHEAVMDDRWRGPVNAVTGSVRQIDFIRTLGKVIRRPTVAPLPGFMVRLLFGQMGTELLLGGQRVVGAQLGELGFGALFPELEGALRFELGK